YEEKVGKEGVCIQTGRKNGKPEPTLDAFDDLDADGIDYMETKDVLKEGRQSNETEEFNKGNVVDAARIEDSAVEPRTPPTTTGIFDDEDITMAQTLIKMKEEKSKEKGVSIKDVEDYSRPIVRDVEIARQLQVDLQAEVERERQREEEASKAVIVEMYDEVQEGIDADALFAAKLQQEEREEYTIEERAKFLAKTIASQRKFRAAQRSTKIRSRPPTKSQLRNLMMTYLKNMGGYKHSQLKAKSFEEIKGMYERQKKSVQDFVPIGSAKEEELIKKMNEKATSEDTSNNEKVLEELNSTKVEVKQEGHKDSTRKRLGRRLKMKAAKKSKRQKTDSDLEEEEQLKAFLMIVPDEEGIIDYEVLEKRFPIINWESKFYEFDRHGYTQRRVLWENLCAHKYFVGNCLWCLLGDFNDALLLADSSAGSLRFDIAMREFKECLDEIEVMDVRSSSLQFTWNQKPKGKEGLLKKIDLVLGNLEFNESFKDVVSERWALNALGFFMFKVVKKLKNLKKLLRKLLYAHGNIHENVTRLPMEADRVQKDLDSDPFNLSLCEKEAKCVNAFNEALIMQERFLKQKAKIHWLKEGDSNLAYFHKAVKSRVSRSRIDVITNSVGMIFENDRVADAFVEHYEVFLRQAGVTQIKEAMFLMGNDKSSGPDSYTAMFFKEAWEIVGSDVILAVGEFFTNGILLKELNHTVIALIPKGKRGLKQGDPLSPYLFTIVMEILTLILRRRVRKSEIFTYHRDCAKMELINLCFADDLFLFAHGDDNSAKVIMELLDEFKLVSRLTHSLPKSTTYFCNVLNCTKLAILQIMPFEEGRLLVKYLGVPLVPSRLVYKDCKELIKKVDGHINDWKNKSLLIAGRLQLVQSVIASMHVYWALVFVLPTYVLLDIEQRMLGFLWCQGSMGKGKVKVAWDAVCLSKEEGGLGVKHLDLFNKALMSSHVWKLLLRRDSLWVKWIHTYKIKHRNV
ncbi:RNA-directed DNA polymerase, eukaryota, reverse transcriptase zinc-binding domain protein, partial [Tanacetum coccineum]